MAINIKMVFRIIKYICCFMPIFSLAYFMSFTDTISISNINSSILETQPTLAIVLLISMICPYIAVILNLIESRLLKNNLNLEYVILNIIILFVSCLFMKNLILCIGFSLAIYSILKTNSIKISELSYIFKGLEVSRTLKEIGGSLIVLLLSAICLFAMIRLGI